MVGAIVLRGIKTNARMDVLDCSICDVSVPGSGLVFGETVE